jgi:hypothetical protein
MAKRQKVRLVAQSDLRRGHHGHDEEDVPDDPEF